MNQHEEKMSEFERELTQAMRAVDPPEGFADRVMTRVETPATGRAKVLTMPHRLRMWASGAVAAALLVGAFVGQQTHARHEREKAERAEQQFETAMRITDQTLDQVRLQLQQAGVLVGN